MVIAKTAPNFLVKFGCFLAIKIKDISQAAKMHIRTMWSGQYNPGPGPKASRFSVSQSKNVAQ